MILSSSGAFWVYSKNSFSQIVPHLSFTCRKHVASTTHFPEGPPTISRAHDIDIPTTMPIHVQRLCNQWHEPHINVPRHPKTQETSWTNPLLSLCASCPPPGLFHCRYLAHQNFSDIVLFAPDRVRQTKGAGKIDSVTFNDQVGGQEGAGE